MKKAEATVITQQQQDSMDHAISHWIANQLNACTDEEEARHFRDRLLSATIHAYFYPHRHEPPNAKKMRIINTSDKLGEIVGNAAAKFINYEKDMP